MESSNCASVLSRWVIKWFPVDSGTFSPSPIISRTFVKHHPPNKQHNLQELLNYCRVASSRSLLGCGKAWSCLRMQHWTVWVLLSPLIQEIVASLVGKSMRAQCVCVYVCVWLGRCVSRNVSSSYTFSLYSRSSLLASRFLSCLASSFLLFINQLMRNCLAPLAPFPSQLCSLSFPVFAFRADRLWLPEVLI